MPWTAYRNVEDSLKYIKDRLAEIEQPLENWDKYKSAAEKAYKVFLMLHITALRS